MKKIWRCIHRGGCRLGTVRIIPHNVCTVSRLRPWSGHGRLGWDGGRRTAADCCRSVFFVVIVVVVVTVGLVWVLKLLDAFRRRRTFRQRFTLLVVVVVVCDVKLRQYTCTYRWGLQFFQGSVQPVLKWGVKNFYGVLLKILVSFSGEKNVKQVNIWQKLLLTM